MESYAPPSLGRSVYINYFEFFWKEDLSLLPYLFTKAFIYVSMDLWVFIYTFGYNPILIYLFICANHFNFGQWEFFHLAVSLCTNPSLCFVSTPLLSGIRISPRLILSTICPSSRINHFLRSSDFFFLENGIRN